MSNACIKLEVGKHFKIAMIEIYPILSTPGNQTQNLHMKAIHKPSQAPKPVDETTT